MDDRRFDNAVRALALHRSRRGVLGGLLGGGVALLAAQVRLPEAAARQGMSGQGEACYDDDQCLSTDTPLVCAYNGYGSAGAACCAGVGGGCADESGCCGPNICYLGNCITSYIPGPGETCWELPGDPDPCDDTSVCMHDAQSGSLWGTCQPLSAGSDGQSSDNGAGCTSRGCSCQLYRDPGCLASCPLYDPCDAGLSCTGTSDYSGTCVPA